MTQKKAIEIMMTIKAEYFYAFKDMPDELFKIKLKNFTLGLKDYSDDEIDIALKFLLKESKTVPTMAHFVEMIERNRELLLPSAEVEWNAISSVLAEMKRNRDNRSPYHITDEQWKEYREKQKTAYNRLSQDVKDFYINYSGFLDLLDAPKIEVEKTRFLKNFTEFRKKQKQKKELEKELKISPDNIFN